MKNIIISALIQVLLLVVFLLLIDSKKEKTSFVKLDKVYEEFQLKKDLEGKFKNIEAKRKSILDSLEFELSLQAKKIENKTIEDRNLMNDYQEKKETYFLKKQQFTQDNQAIMDQYHTQIINKLNEYVSSYGKNNNYSYVLGTDGSGTIMYGKEENDITTEIIKYINNNYKGN